MQDTQHANIQHRTLNAHRHTYTQLGKQEESVRGVDEMMGRRLGKWSRAALGGRGMFVVGGGGKELDGQV